MKTMDQERILFSFSAFLLLGLVFSSGSKSNGVIGNGSTTLPPSESSTQPTVTTLKPTGKHSSSSKNATTSAPEKGCSSYKNCEDCIDKYKCFWCGPSKSCEKWPKNRITPKSCSGNKWYWKQCTVPGYILIIVVPVLGVLILLTCGCCIYCKCCRVKSKNRGEERIKQRREEMKAKHEERKRDRENRTDMIRQKYGLLKSEDEEPLL